MKFDENKHVTNKICVKLNGLNAKLNELQVKKTPHIH